MRSRNTRFFPLLWESGFLSLSFLSGQLTGRSSLPGAPGPFQVAFARAFDLCAVVKLIT